METAEEKAREYVSNQFSRLEHSYEMQEMIFRTDEGFLAGYNEAMRWRDPEVEQPENGEPVIVKYMTARGIKKYGIGKYFDLGIGNPWTIEGSTGREVIGWRPIE